MGLKMSSEAFESLKAKIAKLDTCGIRDLYLDLDLEKARIKDLDMRYRWDLASAAIGTSGICALYDEGLNDTHIDSALRQIVAPL